MAFSQRLKVTGTLDSEGGTQQSCTLLHIIFGEKMPCEGTRFKDDTLFTYLLPTNKSLNSVNSKSSTHLNQFKLQMRLQNSRFFSQNQ